MYMGCVWSVCVGVYGMWRMWCICVFMDVCTHAVCLCAYMGTASSESTGAVEMLRMLFPCYPLWTRISGSSRWYKMCSCKVTKRLWWGSDWFNRPGRCTLIKSNLWGCKHQSTESQAPWRLLCLHSCWSSAHSTIGTGAECFVAPSDGLKSWVSSLSLSSKRF